MGRGDRSNLPYGQFGGRGSTRHARGDRLELPDRLCLRSVLREPRSLEVKSPWPAAGQARWTVSKESALWLRNEAAGIPEKKEKTALAPPRTGFRTDGAGTPNGVA